MGLEFRMCSTGTIHIFDEFGQSLCGNYRKGKCNPISIEEIMGYNFKRIKLLSDLSPSQALAVAEALQALKINICANCVRELYKNI
jgi:hypothetical protein